LQTGGKYDISCFELGMDWKMAASVAADDSREIMAWGRGMTDRSAYDAPFSTWFPVWYDGLPGMIRVLFLVNIACIFALVVYLLWIAYKRRKDCFTLVILLLTGMAQLTMWFLTAPLIRYGLTYMLLLPAFFLGLICQKLNSRVLPWAVCAVGIYCGGLRMFLVASNFTDMRWKRPADYNWKEAQSVMWENMEIYIPVGSDSIGYHFFPSTPNVGRLEAIELRVEDMKGGFRLKEEYRDKQFNSSGVVIE